MLPYKTVSQEDPEWLPKSVVCKSWDTPDKYDICTRTIIGFSVTGWYIDTGTRLWRHAEPVEAWEPQEGERVIAWDEDCDFVCVGASCGYFDHMARLKNPDGSMVDLDCTIEELKQRTEWK